MTKKIRKISTVMALALSLTLLAGCGKKNKDVDVDKMIDKYSAYCQLGEYKGLKYTLTNKQRTEEDLQYQIDYLLYTKSTTEDVTGAVESGDSVNIDFVGTIDGEEFEGGSTQGNGYDLQIGSGKMIPGFEDGIIGHSVGETFDIDVTFPEDYKKDDTSLNGKDAVFKITINSAKRTILPEYNDEFVAANTDYATVAEYETKLKEDIDKSYADSNASYNKSAIITLVEENAIITEYPEKELQELIDEAIESTQEEAASYGYDLATYVVSRYGMASEESFREYVAKLAESYMREKILICAIAKAEGITATKEDISVQKNKMLEQYGMEEKELKEHYSDEDIAYYALSENVYNFLLDNSTGEEATTEAPTTETTTEENTEATSTDASATDAE